MPSSITVSLLVKVSVLVLNPTIVISAPPVLTNSCTMLALNSSNTCSGFTVSKVPKITSLDELGIFTAKSAKLITYKIFQNSFFRAVYHTGSEKEYIMMISLNIFIRITYLDINS